MSTVRLTLIIMMTLSAAMTAVLLKDNKQKVGYIVAKNTPANAIDLRWSPGAESLLGEGKATAE